MYASEARINERQHVIEDNSSIGHNNHHHSSHHKKENDDFDFYVLSMSYQPEFCDSHKLQRFVGCEKPEGFWRGSLTLHGLWPQRLDGSWPASCSNERFSWDVVEEIGEERFYRNWPNVKTSIDDPEQYTQFWAHEWSKHGTCSGLTQKQYFEAALDSFLLTPSIVRERYGSTVSKSELLQSYQVAADMITFVCIHGNYLSEVRVCLEKGSNAKMKCTDTVLDEGNCDDDLIHIPKFYSDSEDSLLVD